MASATAVSTEQEDEWIGYQVELLPGLLKGMRRSHVQCDKFRSHLTSSHYCFRKQPLFLGERIFFEVMGRSSTLNIGGSISFGLTVFEPSQLKFQDLPINSKKWVGITGQDWFFASDVMPQVSEERSDRFVCFERDKTGILLRSKTELTSKGLFEVDMTYSLYPFFFFDGIVHEISVQWPGYDTGSWRCSYCSVRMAKTIAKPCNHMLHCKPCEMKAIVYEGVRCPDCSQEITYAGIQLTTTSLSESYTEFDFIARGGFGIVIQAKHKEYGRICAIKICNAADTIPLQREIKTFLEVSTDTQRRLGRHLVDSLYFVHMFEFWMQDPEHIRDEVLRERIKHNFTDCEAIACISMELCEGNLEQYLQRQAKESAASELDQTRDDDGVPRMFASDVLIKNLQHFRDIVFGVGFLHSEGMIHRDLKPANILYKVIRGDHVFFISDFGLTRPIQSGQEESTAMTEGVGTPTYLAPEQREGNEYGMEVEIYALGIILIEMIHPCVGNAARQSVIRAHKMGEAKLPRKYLNLQLFIKSMIASDPHERPTIAMVTDSISKFIDQISLKDYFR